MTIEKLYVVKTESGKWTAVAPPIILNMGVTAEFDTARDAKQWALEQLAGEAKALSAGEVLTIMESVLVPTPEAWQEIKAQQFTGEYFTSFDAVNRVIKNAGEK